jgi:hypothetical protein
LFACLKAGSDYDDMFIEWKMILIMKGGLYGKVK